MKTCFRRTIKYFIVASIVLAVLGLSSCAQAPTTLVVTVVYDADDRVFPPAAFPGNTADTASWLFLRLMESDGTVTWSNEAAPYNITNLADSRNYHYFINPPDSALTDPGDMYMFDAYFYDSTFVPGGSIDPDMTFGGDAARFTLEAIPAAVSPPFYDPAPHLLTGLRIEPGDQKTLILTTIQIFP